MSSEMQQIIEKLEAQSKALEALTLEVKKSTQLIRMLNQSVASLLDSFDDEGDEPDETTHYLDGTPIAR